MAYLKIQSMPLYKIVKVLCGLEPRMDLIDSMVSLSRYLSILPKRKIV